MLSAEDRERIRAEEWFRREVREEIAKRESKGKLARLFAIVNKPFMLWLFSAFVATTWTSYLAHAHDKRIANRQRAEKLEKIKEELLVGRLSSALRIATEIRNLDVCLSEMRRVLGYDSISDLSHNIDLVEVGNRVERVVKSLPRLQMAVTGLSKEWDKGDRRAHAYPEFFEYGDATLFLVYRRLSGESLIDEDDVFEMFEGLSATSDALKEMDFLTAKYDDLDADDVAGRFLRLFSTIDRIRAAYLQFSHGIASLAGRVGLTPYRDRLNRMSTLAREP